MDRLHLAIQLDALVSTDAPPSPSEQKPAWPATAAGTLSITWLIPQSGESHQELMYRGPLALQVEDYSRRAIVSVRYTYALADLPLRLAKARLLHTLTNLQHDGWALAPVIGAVQHGTLVDRDRVATHLRWAVQAQYVGGRAAPMPKAGTYSAIVLTEIIHRRRLSLYVVPS